MSDLTIKILIMFIFLIFPLYGFLLLNFSDFNFRKKINILYLFYAFCVILSSVSNYFVIGVLLFSILLFINDYRKNRKNSTNMIIPLIFLCFLFASLFSAFIVKQHGLNLFTGYLPVYLYIIILFIFLIIAINYLIKVIKLLFDSIYKNKPQPMQ